MPKKKNKNVGNDDGLDSSDIDPGSGNENSSRKYCHRQIRSNWDRYASENVEESVDETKTNDFADLINSPSDCNYFQFKSEKNWENEASYSTFSGCKFFDLDLEVLSHGLACLPFYERVGIDKSILSQLDIERCDKKANEGLLKYKAIKEKFMKKLDKDYELPGSVEEISDTTTEVKKSAPQVMTHTSVIDKPFQVETVFQDEEKLVDDKTDCEKNVKQIKTEEESLEEWLDSVLDD